MDLFDILILIGLLAVVITLGLGFYALRVGGEFGRKYSNKLMRLRVLLQFVTVAILALAFYVHRH
jgi:hypothetical protein